MSHPREDALLFSIEACQDELVHFTRGLIRIPSVNPPGEHYRDCTQPLGDRLAARGFEVTYVRAEGAPGDCDRYPRWNVIARREGSGPGPCVHFNSHIDVVAAGEGWSVPPFEAVVKDGRVYGRGACDMKGGLAASVIAVEALIDGGVGLPGAIEISGTADGESGGYGGVAELSQRGSFLQPRAAHQATSQPP